MLWQHLGNTSALGPYTVQSGTPFTVFCNDQWLGDADSFDTAERIVLADIGRQGAWINRQLEKANA